MQQYHEWQNLYASVNKLTLRHAKDIEFLETKNAVSTKIKQVLTVLKSRKQQAEHERAICKKDQDKTVTTTVKETTIAAEAALYELKLA